MKGAQSMLGIAQDSKLWAGPWYCSGEVKMVRVENHMVLYQRYCRERWESLDDVGLVQPTKRHVKWLAVEETTLGQLQHERGEFDLKD